MGAADWTTEDDESSPSDLYEEVKTVNSRDQKADNESNNSRDNPGTKSIKSDSGLLTITFLL